MTETPIRYRLRDRHGNPLPGFGLDMPRPGETVADLKRRLTVEFGDRIRFESEQPEVAALKALYGERT